MRRAAVEEELARREARELADTTLTAEQEDEFAELCLTMPGDDLAVFTEPADSLNGCGLELSVSVEEREKLAKQGESYSMPDGSWPTKDAKHLGIAVGFFKQGKRGNYTTAELRSHLLAASRRLRIPIDLGEDEHKTDSAGRPARHRKPTRWDDGQSGGAWGSGGEGEGASGGDGGASMSRYGDEGDSLELAHHTGKNPDIHGSDSPAASEVARLLRKVARELRTDVHDGARKGRGKKVVRSGDPIVPAAPENSTVANRAAEFARVLNDLGINPERKHSAHSRCVICYRAA